MSIFGVWMWSKAVRLLGAKKVVEYNKRANVTDIYFLTKGLQGTTGYFSELAPHVCERDLLQELIDEAHKNGIRVHAWFTCSFDANYKKLYPEAGRCHYTRGKDKDLISLADEGYIEYMKKITREICTKYDIDGLHLDYIRYNHMLYGWAEEDMARFEAEGADVAHLRKLIESAINGDEFNSDIMTDAYNAGDESVLAFARSRRKDVVKFATALTKTAREVKPEIILTAALMPEGAFDNIAFADLHYGQNYEDASKIYDYVLPMAYTKAYHVESPWMKTIADNTLKHGIPAVMGIHAYDEGTCKSMQDDIAAMDGCAIDGICLFRDGSTAMAYAEGKKLSIVNALDDTITKVIAMCGEQTAEFDCEIVFGDEKSFDLPFEADCLRVFTGDVESLAYLTK